MKRTIALLLALVLCLSLCACGSENATAEDDTYTTSDAESDFLYNDDIEAIVVGALYDEIDSKYDTADAGSSRYEINKIDRKFDAIYVYGSVTLYDKYGMTTTGWTDGSGTPFRSFEVKISEDGYALSCDIS